MLESVSTEIWNLELRLSPTDILITSRVTTSKSQQNMRVILQAGLFPRHYRPGGESSNPHW